MKDLLFKTILDTVKYVVLIVVAGAVFHFVYPKYTSHLMRGGIFRLNQVTGQLDLIGSSGSWENYSQTEKTATKD